MNAGQKVHQPEHDQNNLSERFAPDSAGECQGQQGRQPEEAASPVPELTPAADSIKFAELPSGPATDLPTGQKRNRADKW